MVDSKAVWKAAMWALRLVGLRVAPLADQSGSTKAAESADQRAENSADTSDAPSETPQAVMRVESRVDLSAD